LIYWLAILCNFSDNGRVDTEKPVVGYFYSSILAMLLVNIFKIKSLVYLGCSGEMKIMSFLTETETVGRILQHIGEPHHAPTTYPTRDSPINDTEINQPLEWDVTGVEPL